MSLPLQPAASLTFLMRQLQFKSLCKAFGADEWFCCWKVKRLTGGPQAHPRAGEWKREKKTILPNSLKGNFSDRLGKFLWVILLGKCFSSLMCLDYKVSGSYCLSLKRGCEVVFSYYLQNNSEGSSPPPHDVWTRLNTEEESPLRTVLLKLPALSFATDIAHLLGNVPPASCALDCVSVWNRVRESTGSRTEKRRFAQEKQGAFLFLDHNTCHAGSQFPKQGLNPCSLHWKLGVPTTGVSSVA